MNKNEFYVPENYQEIIDNSTIVKDFEIFLNLAKENKLELSKSNILTNKSCILLNEEINRKIYFESQRPNLKSFPNVIGLFISFVQTGMSEITHIGKKKFLSVNQDLLNQWETFSELEKYFYLFSVVFSGVNFDIINESIAAFTYIVVLDDLFKGNIKSRKLSGFYDGYETKTLVLLAEMFGLIKIKDSLSKDKKKWMISDIENINHTYKTFKSIHNLIVEFLNQLIEDCNKIAEVEFFAKKIQNTIPEFKKRLKFEPTPKQGAYIFKASLLKASRSIEIDTNASVDELCRTIIKAFNFDLDHMYELSYKDRFGSIIRYTGAPDLSVRDYHEGSFTFDAKIKDLDLKENQELNFLFDFGDCWDFDILLQSIDESRTDIKTKIIETKGKAPEQYPENW